MTDTIHSEVQQFATDMLVELYTIDASALGAGVFYFTPVSNTTSSHPYQNITTNWQDDTQNWDAGGSGYGPLVYGGISYTPIDIQATGFEWSSQGTLPAPKLQVANTNFVMNAAVITYGDLLGAIVTRCRTFRKFLDDGTTPDPTSHFPLDIYKIDQKSGHNKIYIEWQLAASLDQEGRKLPSRQVLRDACTHIYRIYNSTTGAFDYTQATCTYTGTQYFDATDSATFNPALDSCGRRISSCRCRFGQNGDLPTRAFPGSGTTS
jgi:lambda family phage minor tail protein L